ncbi:hypothetical protein Ocin01_15866 [Orchesella cincta]|uniref:Uncharacterized protein n=1 Tax=Orchesella cincta TaxID=48709 RepID=A0A1D2MCT9_ORCCI|nr:hypothetical protein Ocin01_15866 [Orchesella cincta]
MAANRRTSLRSRRQTDHVINHSVVDGPQYSWDADSIASLSRGALIFTASHNGKLIKGYIGRLLGNGTVHSFVGQFLPEKGLLGSPIKSESNEGSLYNDCEILLDSNNKLCWKPIKDKFVPHSFNAIVANIERDTDEKNVFIGKVTSEDGVGIGTIYSEGGWKINYCIQQEVQAKVIDLQNGGNNVEVLCLK